MLDVIERLFRSCTASDFITQKNSKNRQKTIKGSIVTLGQKYLLFSFLSYAKLSTPDAPGADSSNPARVQFATFKLSYYQKIITLSFVYEYLYIFKTRTFCVPCQLAAVLPHRTVHHLVHLSPMSGLDPTLAGEETRLSIGRAPRKFMRAVYFSDRLNQPTTDPFCK